MNAYQILGLPRTATEDDIKKAYRKLAMKHHPDREGGSEEKFKEIKEAYEYLMKMGDHVKMSDRPFGKKSSPFSDDKYDECQDYWDYSDKIDEILRRHAAEWMSANNREDLHDNQYADYINKRETSNKFTTVYQSFPLSAGFSGSSGVPKGAPPEYSYYDSVSTGVKRKVVILFDCPKGYEFKNKFTDHNEFFVGDLLGNLAVPESMVESGGWATIKTPIDGTEVELRIPAGIEYGKMLKLKGIGYWNWKRGPVSRGDVYIKILKPKG